MHFQSNLRHLRKSKGMTQDELASLLDINKGTVSAYETGRVNPTLEGLLRLCEIFGVSPDELILHDLLRGKGREEQPPPPAYGMERTEREELLTRMNQLLERRVAELEREIREHNPELVKKLGIG